MNWHWNTWIQRSSLHSSVKIHYSIASTQQTSKSRRRWWSPLRPSYYWVQEKANRQYCILVRRDEEGLRQCSALVDRKMDISSGKRWRTEEKISISSSIPVPSSNPRTFRKYNQSCIARQCTVTRRSYRVYLSRRKRKRNWGQEWLMVWFQEESVSKQADMLCSSLLWFRWILKMAQGKPYATCQKQEARHTKIIGNTFRIQYFGAIWSLPKREVCNFT